MQQPTEVTNREVYCPDCQVKMHKAGFTWSGRRKVQRWRCPKCGTTTCKQQNKGNNTTSSP